MKTLHNVSLAKTVISSLVIAVIVTSGLLIVIFKANNSSSEAPVDNETQPADTYRGFGYYADDLAAYDNLANCWTVIDGHVYDVSDFVSNHPDRDAFAKICGSDGTSLFKDQEFYHQLPHKIPNELQLQLLGVFIKGDKTKSTI